MLHNNTSQQKHSLTAEVRNKQSNDFCAEQRYLLIFNRESEVQIRVLFKCYVLLVEENFSLYVATNLRFGMFLIANRISRESRAFARLKRFGSFIFFKLLAERATQVYVKGGRYVCRI